MTRTRTASHRGPGLQQRLEAWPAGRVVISVFLMVTLAAIVVTNLPESRVRREAMMVANPYLVATGLDQKWRIFAPPRRTSLRMEARVTYEDGSVAVWRPPHGGDLLGTYWDYRWRKWLENVTQDVNRKVLWKPAAQFAAREVRRPGKLPIAVTLIRRAQDLRPPGADGPDTRRWKSYAYYTLPSGALRLP